MTFLTEARTCLAAATLLMMQVGCGVQYNGAFSFPAEQQEQIDAYHADRQASQVVHQTSESEQPSGVRPATRRGASASVHTPMRGAPFVTVDEQARATEPVSRSRDTGLSLFGQVPEPVGEADGGAYNADGSTAQAGASSPLDSPRNVRQITFATEGADFDPVTDPTGLWLAYASTRHRETSDIYIKKIGGSAVTQLTKDPANDGMPAFSPDGKTIAFASDRGGDWNVYVMDIAGGQPVQLTSDVAHDVHPSFSPDGKWIVYSTFGQQSGQWELASIEVANPRGTRWFSVWTIELEDGEAQRPTEVAAAQNAASITPRFSPDGQFIVFSTVVNPDAESQERPTQADVWIVGADGSGRVNLTHSPFANLQPTWAADGRIYFVSNRSQDGLENIWSIQPARARSLVEATQSQGDNATVDGPAPGDATTAEVPVPVQP